MAASSVLPNLPDATRSLQFVSYNCQQPGPGTRYRQLFSSIACAILALQSTGIRAEQVGQRHM
eukprot:13895743-Heterocapsa_arctica.AAC.1